MKPGPVSGGYEHFVSLGGRKRGRDAATVRKISLLRKAGPLKRLNAHANGFLAGEGGREAPSPRERESERERERDRVSF